MDLTKLVKTEEYEQQQAERDGAPANERTRHRYRIKKHSTMGKTSCALAGAALLLSLMVVPAKSAAGGGVATIFLILICFVAAICAVGVVTAFMGLATKRRKPILSVFGLLLNPAIFIALMVFLNWPTAGDLVPAAAGGKLESVDKLLRMGIDVNLPGRVAIGEDTIMTPLQAAADAGHVDVVNLLLDHGANLNDVDAQQRTALFMAVSKGHLDASLAILAKGADPNKGPAGTSPLTVAVGNTQADIVEALLNHQANANPPDGLPLMTAAEKGNTRIAELLLQHGAEVNAQHTETKNTAMHAAAENGNFHMVQLLIRKQAKVDLRNAHNETALDLAIAGGFDTVIERLVNVGSPIDIFSAIGLDDLEKVKTELEADASLITAKRRGLTPLHMAAREGKLEIAKFLIAQEAPIDARTKEQGGMTPLHIAVLRGHVAIVELLLTHAADPNPSMIADGTTAPPLYFAVIQERPDLTELLLDAGADVNVQCNTPAMDAPPIYFAVQHNDMENAKLLMEARADVNLRKNQNNPTALFAAIENHNVEMVELLIENGADVNAVRGNTSPMDYSDQLHQNKPEDYDKIVKLLKKAMLKE